MQQRQINLNVFHQVKCNCSLLLRHHPYSPFFATLHYQLTMINFGSHPWSSFYWAPNRCFLNKISDSYDYCQKTTIHLLIFITICFCNKVSGSIASRLSSSLFILLRLFCVPLCASDDIVSIIHHCFDLFRQVLPVVALAKVFNELQRKTSKS